MATDSVIILVLLGACLIALILVMIARKEAEAVRVQARLDTRDLHDRLKRMREDLERREARLEGRTTAADERENILAQRAEGLNAQHAVIETQLVELNQAQAALAADQTRLAEDRSGLTQADAEARILAHAEKTTRLRAGRLASEIEDEARRSADARAREVIVTAMLRGSSEFSYQAAVSTIELPNDEYRGRVIGKEGRNINTFMALTGVDVVLDDDSLLLVLSSFDTERREIAVAAMEELLADGRIQPDRIEAAVQRATETVEHRQYDRAVRAAQEAGVVGLSDDTLKLLGKLSTTTSYGQIILTHLVESSKIAAGVAAEVGADAELARRGALLHDIGKAISDPANPSHALAGAHFLKEQGESDLVVNAVAAHHDEVAPESIEAVIVQIADITSAARPGARRETVADHLKRVRSIEGDLKSLSGVEEVIVLAAGRDIRVIVNPDETTEDALSTLADRAYLKVTEDHHVGGSVSVTIIREKRVSRGPREG